MNNVSASGIPIKNCLRCKKPIYSYSYSRKWCVDCRSIITNELARERKKNKVKKPQIKKELNPLRAYDKLLRENAKNRRKLLEKTDVIRSATRNPLYKHEFLPQSGREFVKRILDNCFDDEISNMIKVMYTLKMRMNQVCKIRTIDIDEENHNIHIIINKRGKNTVNHIPKYIRDILYSLKRIRDAEGLMFLFHHHIYIHKPFSGRVFSDRIRLVMTRAGYREEKFIYNYTKDGHPQYRLTPNSIRHAIACDIVENCMKKGINLNEHDLATLMHHSTTVAARSYILTFSGRIKTINEAVFSKDPFDDTEEEIIFFEEKKPLKSIIDRGTQDETER